jgi:uncharacterized tellurite resistance protein B-like protein
VSFLSHLKKRSAEAEAAGSTETVRKIVHALDHLEPERARFVAAFAYVLGRVANADSDISEPETRTMERIVEKFGGLPEDQAVLAVQIAKSQNRLFGGTETFLVTREFREISGREQREKLLDALFAVSAADNDVSVEEEAQIRQIADELGFPLEDFVRVRSKYSDRRAVLRALEQEG